MRATPKLANKVSRCAPFLPNHLESPTLFWVFPYPRLQSSAPMATGPPEHLSLGHQSSVHPPQSTQKGFSKVQR